MSGRYPQSFRIEMVKRMTGPNAISAGMLAKEVAPCQSVLSGWLRKARAVGLENYFQEHDVSDQPSFSPDQKLKLILEADALDQEQLGPFLRRNGLHLHQLQQWRQLILGSLKNPNALSHNTRSHKAATKAARKRIQQLERELARKDKALAETAALLVLQKKVQTLWQDEEPSSPKSKGG